MQVAMLLDHRIVKLEMLQKMYIPDQAELAKLSNDDLLFSVTP
jgi:hypothetical protein